MNCRLNRDLVAILLGAALLGLAALAAASEAPTAVPSPHSAEALHPPAAQSSAQKPGG